MCERFDVAEILVDRLFNIRIHGSYTVKEIVNKLFFNELLNNSTVGENKYPVADVVDMALCILASTSTFNGCDEANMTDETVDVIIGEISSNYLLC